MMMMMMMMMIVWNVSQQQLACLLFHCILRQQEWMSRYMRNLSVFQITFKGRVPAMSFVGPILATSKTNIHAHVWD